MADAMRTNVVEVGDSEMVYQPARFTRSVRVGDGGSGYGVVQDYCDARRIRDAARTAPGVEGSELHVDEYDPTDFAHNGVPGLHGVSAGSPSDHLLDRS